MIPLNIRTNLDIDPWLDLNDPAVRFDTGAVTAKLERIGLLPNGTKGGKATVGLAIRIGDGPHAGQYVIAETTWRLLHLAVLALSQSPVAEMEEM